MITWSVDAVSQTSPETLKVGPNTVTRSAKSATGEIFSAIITVHYDNVPPGRPVVTGPVGPVSNMRPAWSWESAGEGNGTFRFRLDTDNFTTGATVAAVTSFTPAANLTVGPHTLYVQERDSAGNWSLSGSHAVRIDTTPPPAPVVTVLPASPTNNTRPAWSWTGTAAEGKASYRYKLNNNDFRTGATAVSASGYTPAVGSELLEGPHTLYVQQQDSAGNWSNPGSAAVTVDLTAPAMPKVSVTSTTAPTFSWISGGGGNGKYQVKMNSSNFATGAIDVAAGVTAHSPTGLAEGKHAIYVREADAAGNWSLPDSESVWLDKTIPAITNPGNKTITSTSTTLTFSAADGMGTGVKTASCKWGTTTVAADFSGSTWSCAVTGLTTVQTTVTLEAVDGAGLKGTATLIITVNLPVQQVVVAPKFKKYAIGLNYVTVDYTLDGSPKKIEFTSLKAGENKLEIVGPANTLGQVSKDTAFVYSLPNVVFVDKNAAGTQKGDSWENAFTSLNAALNSTKGSTSGTDIWVTTGVYGFPEGNLTFWVSTGVELFGGFPVDGSAVNTQSMNMNNKTILSASSSWEYMVTLNSNTTLNNFEIMLENRVVYTGALKVNGTNVKVQNSTMDNWWIGDGIYVKISDNASVTFENSSLSKNDAPFTSHIVIGESCTVDFNNTKINDNVGSFADWPFAVVGVGANSRIRLLNSSQIKGTNNLGAPMPAIELGDGAHLAISSNSSVTTAVTGTGKSCAGTALPCP